MSKKIRLDIWNIYNKDLRIALCWCCKITKIDGMTSSWHVGHVISKANGGTDNIDNLRPICIECNLSMGKQNMDDFIKMHYSTHPAFVGNNLSKIIKPLNFEYCDSYSPSKEIIIDLTEEIINLTKPQNIIKSTKPQIITKNLKPLHRNILSIMRECEDGGYIYRADLNDRIGDIIDMNLSSFGTKTPLQSLSLYLQHMRDKKIIKFISRGVYQISN